MTEPQDRMPVFEGGFVAAELDFTAGEAFWSRLEELVAADGPSEHLDAAMGGKPAPRTWLFLHPPGRGAMSAAAALSFARALADRDQSALVLDGDEEEGALTGWIERVDQEGWIDLARYGTSVLTSGVTLPFPGRRGYVMGVGSFTPTDVTGEEIKALMARLRRQADDIMVVAPANDFGLAWAAAADARILCWDPATLSRSENEDLAARFAAAGHPVTGVMVFGAVPAPGLDAPEDVIVEEVFTETEREDLDHEGFEEEVVGKSAPDEPRAPAVSGDDDDEDDEGWGEPRLGVDADEEPHPGRKSSGVFWIGAVAAVLVIVVAFVYWFKVLRVPSEGHFDNVPAVATGRPGDRPVDPAQPAAGDGATDRTPAVADTAAVAGPGEAAVDSMATADEDAAGEVVHEGVPEEEPETGTKDVPIVAETQTGESGRQPADDGSTAEPTEAGEAATEAPAPAAAESVPAAFDMAPFEEPVGRDGWALHVYSLPSMESLQVELKELERRGFRSAVKAVDIEGKGRWYRVYLGNFATRAAANAAKPGLLEKLGEDYAAARRFEATPSE